MDTTTEEYRKEIDWTQEKIDLIRDTNEWSGEHEIQVKNKFLVLSVILKTKEKAFSFS